ncbi:type II secretion system secretin GspD [Sulfurimonas sp.]|uniref:type II secretion system secretin GspD n=1 Tax=Sulfurimonas sp. TaxID=2022749 RepID=UPI0019ED1EDA|nr:type II secretion system secretin GspD [Sulfurimonas sp.]MBE0513719.1 type II secretion system secretin GspD [Sulfurimonas sp.]
MKLIRGLFIIVVFVASLSARERVNINFSNLQINDFVKLVSKITNKNILMNHQIIGTVDFISTTDVYDDELMDILVSTLESKGFSIVKSGSMYEIVRSADIINSNVAVVEQGKTLYGSFMVTQVIKVKNENVDIIAAKIQYLISKNAKMMTVRESNTLLITDYPKNIETIKKVVKDIDTDRRTVIEIIPIKFAESKKFQARLVDVAKSLFNEHVPSQGVKIMLDENTNSIILIGIKENVSRIQEIAATLDIEPNINNAVQIYELKNSDAKTVLESLNEIISKQTFADPALKPNVSANEEINAILVVGEANVIKGIKFIIDELDKEKYQVYVKARIVEINKNSAKDLGVKYGFAAGDVSSSGLYAMSANFGDPGLTDLASVKVLDYLGAIGAGAKSAFALGATLDFLENNGASKSVSNPSILCVNNQESSIYVGKTISVTTGSVTSSATSVPGTTNSYKREDVGLTLRIKPRVSSLDKVTLNVEAILENVLDDGKNNSTGQPITSKQEVKTQAILRNGEDIIIGGLVKSFESTSKSKIPLLGDIPWIGELLFTSTSKATQEDNLVVILTPYIINQSEKLSLLQQDLGVLTTLQREYNDAIFKKIQEGEPGVQEDVAQEEE